MLLTVACYVCRPFATGRMGIILKLFHVNRQLPFFLVKVTQGR